jgi:hypothetical protein
LEDFILILTSLKGISHGRVELTERTGRKIKKKTARDYKSSPINPLDSGVLAWFGSATCFLAKARWLQIACDFHNGKGSEDWMQFGFPSQTIVILEWEGGRMEKEKKLSCIKVKKKVVKN